MFEQVIETFEDCFWGEATEWAIDSRSDLVGKIAQTSLKAANLFYSYTWSVEAGKRASARFSTQAKCKISRMNHCDFPALLGFLDLAGCIIASMRWGLKIIAHRSITAGADYILKVLKSNHPADNRLEQWFQQMQADGSLPTHEHTTESGHHRIDTHRLDTLLVDSFALYQADVGRTKYCRRDSDSSVMEQNHHVVHYLSGLPAAQPQNCRCHSPALGIENGLHWILDVTFGWGCLSVRSLHAHNLALSSSLLPSMPQSGQLKQ